MRTASRRALTCAALLCAAAPAAGAPLQTVVRVEGQAATLVPESAIAVDDTGVTPFFDVQTFTQLDAGNATVLAQLGRTAAAAGLDLAIRVFDFGAGPLAFTQKIGPDAGAGSVGWSFRVNHAQPGFAAANDVTLKAGDSVLWFYGAGGARTLEVAVSSDRVRQGAPLRVTVVSHDDTGAPAPAAGATVAYGDAVVVADAAGRADFVGQAPGTRAVRATRAGDVRSATRPVCSYAEDPTVCNLPASPPPVAPPPAAPAPSVAGSGAAGDATPPGSRIAFPLSGRAYAAVRAVRGTAGPDRSDVAGVDVALAQRVGTQCRFLRPGGGFLPPGPCAVRRYLTARSVGGAWLLPLRRPLAAGVYRVWSRAADGAGNREGLGLAGVNTLQFRVAPRLP